MKALNLLQTLKLSAQLVTEMDQMMKRPYWSREQIEAYQLKKIKILVDEARHHSPLYQDKSLPDSRDIQTLADVAKLPILTKAELLDRAPSEIISDRYDAEDLIVSKSSGSTGKALDVYYDEFSYNLFILAGLRLYLMAFDYRPWHRQTYIYTSPYPLKSLFGLYPLDFISTLNPVADTIKQIQRNKPDLLVCYPSHLRSIAEQMTEKDLAKLKIKAINVNSEMSSAKEREELAKRFNAFVFDDYSSEELTRIASQCRHLQYHIFDDINYIEIVNEAGELVPEGEVGSIVGTNLHNIGMPLIRYNQGDRGAIRTQPCVCGRNFRILEKLEGRRNDAFVLSSGETLSSGYLLDLTYGVFLDFPGAVAAFCLIQNEADRWLLELVPGKNWHQELVTKIPSTLLRNLGRSQVHIQAMVVQDVRKTASGKANPIVSLVKR
ncbi:MAG: phenylacetate--CoA ligase family protein [Bacillota bacterium]